MKFFGPHTYLKPNPRTHTVCDAGKKLQFLQDLLKIIHVFGVISKDLVNFRKECENVGAEKPNITRC